MITNLLQYFNAFLAHTAILAVWELAAGFANLKKTVHNYYFCGSM